MYCQYCGKRIDDDTVFCPHCGENLKQEPRTGVSKKKRKRNHKVSPFAITAILVACSVLIGISLVVILGIGKKDNNVKKIREESNAVAEAFNNTDMESINRIIFNEKNSKQDNESDELPEDGTNEAGEGVLESIFKHVTVKVDKITDDSIVFKIKAPDMTNFFTNLNENTESLSEAELLQLIKEYAANTNTKEERVSLDYSIVNDRLVVNYRDESFINAVTGGFLEAYISLYNGMINEIAEGMR